MNRLKLLLVTNLYPTPAEPTRGIFVHQLVLRLCELCDVTVVCPLPWFPALPLPGAGRWRGFSQVPAEYDMGPVHVQSPKYPLIPRFSENIHAHLMYGPLYRAVRALHSKRGFDVLNAQWLHPDGVACAWIGERLKLPVVLSALGSDVNVFMEEPAKWKQILASFRTAAGITTVSRALKERLVAAGVAAEKIAVIPNGADAGLFRLQSKQECREALGLDPATKAIVFVGRIVEIKGVNHLIEAAQRLAQRRQDFAVYLVGDGPLREPYAADVRARGLEQRVRWMGARPHDEIARWMCAADVFCLPSLNEGWPNVVLEALFAGRPVVASRTGGIPEMVGPSNGLLPEPGDAAGMADALDRALSRQWDAQEIRASVAQFTWETAAGRYHDVFVRASRIRDS